MDIYAMRDMNRFMCAILLSAADQLQCPDGTLTILTVKMASGRAFEPLSEANVTCSGGQDSCHLAHQTREY